MSKTVISIPIEKYTFSELDNDIARVRINVFHNSYNPNGSFFEDESLENSQESFKNKPLCCAYQYNDENEIEDFKEHNEEEKPVGVIPETNNYSIEEIDELKWAVTDGIVFKEYCPEAYQLLKDGKKISMEIEVLEGFKGKDNFFHIKRFNLLCITILGDAWQPAMGENATIELFSKTDSESFATKFSAIINKANEIVGNVSTEGGKKVKREEIISKFSTLNEKVEGYKVIIDNSELSDEELEKQLFALSQNQLNQFINESISTETIIKQYWDGESYETQKYWLEDVVIADNIAVLWSREDYKNYGVPYFMSGDKVTLDYENAKRYVVGDWRPFEDGQSEPSNPIEMFANDIVEQATTQINKTKDSFNAKETEEYKTLETELNTKVGEFKVIEGELDKVKSDYTTLQSDKFSLDEEVKDLRQFKADKEQEFKEAQVNEVLAKFTELEKVEGYDELIKDKFNYTLDELETKLKVFAFDNNIVVGKKQKFTRTNEQSPVNLPIEGKSNNSGYTGAWDVLEKYTK
jgi:hypothetical protein